ncbi:site-specific integrase [Duganella sp.]|uniref:site-specific integrase n=1 Tax=Duganella sp. TaxID=1904440 RepID=UPI0031DDEE9B
MAIKLPSHLHRSRSGTLHFRIAIPPDLRHHFASCEIYRSLRTASVREAVPAAQALSQAAKRAFQRLRKSDMSEQKKTASGPYGEDWGIFGGPDSPQPGSSTGCTDSKQDGVRLDLITEIHLDEFMRPKLRLIPEPDDRPEDRINAQVEFLQAVGVAGASGQVPRATVKDTPVVSSYVDAYLDSFPPSQRPNDKSLEAYRAAIITFIKIVGDKPLHALGIQDRNRYDDIIVKLPVNSNKLAACRGLSIDEMLLLNLKPISLQNAKQSARRTNGFLWWAFDREGSEPPFQLLARVKVNKKKKVAKTRRAFTDDELRMVFNPATLGRSTQASPYMFWLPLIGAHTGMRINEIAQLELSDLVTLDGIPCFNVTDSPDPEEEPEAAARAKTIKTDAGRRIVPIHARLVALGLLAYADALRTAGHTRLFPDLVGGRDGPGQPASKQFGRYCDRIKLTDPELVFHSFRHGAVGRMRSAKVPKELRMVVVGHSASEDTHDDYGDIQNDYSVHDKLAAVAALDFDGVIDYAALAQRAPTLAALERSLAARSKRK